MKRIIVCFFILPLLAEIKAQNPFSHVLNEPTNGVFVNAAVSSFDGGYILIGGTAAKGLIAKIDSTGKLVWNKILDNNNPFAYPEVALNAISSTVDSCYIIAGSATNPSVTQNGGLVIKISANGNILWSKTITSSSTIRLYSIRQTSDSGYVVAGDQYVNNAPNSRVFVAKLDESGNLAWSANHTAGNNKNLATCIRQTSDSTYLVAGFIESCSPCDGHFFLTSLSSTGNILWSRKYQPAQGTFPTINDFLVLPDGLLLYLTLNGSPGLVKTDLVGNINWSYVYNYQPFFNAISSITPKIHKNTDSHFTLVNGNCGLSQFIKVDSLGNVHWVKTLTLNALDVLATKDNGYLVFGNGPLCTVRTTSSMKREIGLIKTDSLGNGANCVSPVSFTMASLTMSWSPTTFSSVSSGTLNTMSLNSSSLSSLSSHPDCVSFVGAVENDRSDDLLTIYPNPFTSKTTLQVSTPVGNSVLTLIDGFGRMVTEIKIISGQTISFYRNGLPSGLYIIRLTNEDKTIATSKLIITD